MSMPFFVYFFARGVLSLRTRGEENMVVYWDLAAAFDLLTDYLLLRVTQRLAGRQQPTRRLWLAAALGAAGTVANLALSLGAAGALLLLPLVGAAAFAGTGRAAKLTALFAALSCALGGGVLLLGAALGSVERLARGVLTAQLPWGVFFAAAGLCYVALGVVLRGGARHDGESLVRVTLKNHGSAVTLTLLRDSGNTLTDPDTGRGLPVIGESALRPVLPSADKEFSLQGFSSVGQPCGMLRTFVCPEVELDGRALGTLRIALAPQLFGDGGYQGLWPAEGGDAHV